MAVTSILRFQDNPLNVALIWNRVKAPPDHYPIFFVCVEKYFPFSGTFMEHFFGYSATGFFFLGGKGEIFGTKNPPLPAATDYL